MKEKGKSSDSGKKPGLQNAFGEQRGDSARVGLSYDHPNETALKEALIQTLAESPTGNRLLTMGRDYKVNIRVVKGTGPQGYTTEGKALFLAAPPARKKPKPVDVLNLGAALREIEHEIMGFAVPAPGQADPLEIASLVHAKFLDMIVHMCKISREMVEKKADKAYTDAIEDLGHGDIYRTFLAEMGDEGLVDAYLQTE